MLQQAGCTTEWYPWKRLCYTTPTFKAPHTQLMITPLIQPHTQPTDDFQLQGFIGTPTLAPFFP